MNNLGVVFTLSPVSQSLVNKFSKTHKTYYNRELFLEQKILNSPYVNASLIRRLFEAKYYLEDNFGAYSKFRNKIIPNTYKYNGKYYKYHTYIKLIQSFLLCGINIQNIKSFYDICGAPGEWVRSLLKECPIKRAYAISLYEHGIPYDKDIYNMDNLRIISPKDGNIYKIKNLQESLKYIDKVDLVCCDGGFNSRKFVTNESLQALVHIHLIFAEFVYGLFFTKLNTGVFFCKVFDLLDEITVQILMCATIFYGKVSIVKPIESRSVNSEKYLLCQNLEFNDDKYILRNKLVNLLVQCQNTNPGEIFDKNVIDEDSIKKFKESLIKINNKMVSKQADEIFRVVNLSIKFSNQALNNRFPFRK